MIIGDLASETFEKVEYEDAKNTTIAVVLDEKKHAPRFAMRVFRIGPGGYTPRHSHWWEHEIFVLKGKGRLWGKGEWHPLTPGTFALVEPDEEHQFVAADDDQLEFICLVPLRK